MRKTKLPKYCHPEAPSFGAEGSGRTARSVAVLGDAIIARLVRFLINPAQPNATDYYSSAGQVEFIRYSSFCNRFATSPQYRRVIKLPF